jgi:hypothetical protein
MPDDTIGDLARQDLYPDERGFQPPPNPVDLPPEAYASLGGGDLGLLGQKGLAGLFGGQSWLQKAQDLGAKDIANYQTGGVPAVIGSLADTSDAQDLAGGFGGNIKGVEGKLGALADLAPHAPPFYSAVEQAVQGAKQTTAPGQQWAGFLRNQPGVKPEELSTLKLGDLFDQTAVTKQDLLDHIAANKVQLGEVRKGGGYELGKEVGELTQENERLSRLYDETVARGGDTGGIIDNMNANHDRIRDLHELADQNLSTKFSQYTLPGGENYRETLLTLPDKGQPSDWQVVEHPSGVGYSIRNSRGEYGLTPDGTRDAVFSTPDNARASIADYAATQSERPEFKSTHFDEPNILAHIRTNDRVIDGKKTLFVEEVQSDWHQKGKREGYQGDFDHAQALVDRNRFYNGKGNMSDAEWSALSNRVKEYDRLEGGVPDAPFKTTWPDLAMKRVIRQAAEGGYDKVAWTPGSVQADRYDLSKQLRELQYLKNEDGTYQIAGTTHNGEGFNHPDNVSADKLPDVVGKEMAQKIVNNEGKRARGHPANGGYFDGVDLKVGGEGMKGFYDQILPAAVNKIVKKAGGRVEQGEIQGHQFKGYQSYSAGEGPTGAPAVFGVDENGVGRIIRQDVASIEEARAAAQELNQGGKKQPVHTLDITPQLREMALKKGFPLFAAGGIAATGMMGDLAKQDDYQ